MNSNLITIVIATYNAEAYLQTCLNSIIPQLNNDIELVIIDGESKDGTVEIIKNFKQYIKYWISEPDKGIYDAWNKGIKISNSKWIMFIGADDELFPNAINKYVNLLASQDFSSFDYISAQNEYVDSNDKLIKLLGEGAEWKLLRKGMSAAHVASLHHKKNLFENIGYYNLEFSLCADYELLLRKKNNLKSYFLPVRIGKMKVGGMSFSTRAIKQCYEIRKLHNSISPISNVILFLRDYFAFKFFKFRKWV